MLHRSRIAFGRSLVVVRAPGEWLSGRIGVRVVVVCVALLLATFGVAVFALGTGDYAVAPGQVLRALFAAGSPRDELVVLEWRLPRVLLALVFGAALAVSGAILQSLTRNPLGSPDIVGFNTGAYSGALVVILLTGGGYYAVAAGALAGGIATALVVYLLAFKQGVRGFRLIIVGIAVSAVLGSLNTWLSLKADLDDAISAAVWGAGSLAGLGWAQVPPVLIATAVLVPVVAVAARRMPLLELGDDAARALGVRAEPARLLLLFTSVGLTAVVTAAAGPIAFVSLAAPQLARRLTRTGGIGLMSSASMGAFLLVACDWLAQRVFAPTVLPVGVVTVSIGGLYLVWLLAGEARRR
ncbi:FecCD family ABC transporter permease [Amycolatopsis ultiminotia]